MFFLQHEKNWSKRGAKFTQKKKQSLSKIFSKSFQSFQVSKVSKVFKFPWSLGWKAKTEKDEKEKINGQIVFRKIKKRMVLLFSKFSSFFFDENGIFWKFVPGILLTGFSFAGAGMFYGIEGGNNSTETGCPQFTFWSSLFYVNTVITSIGKKICQ